MDYKKYVADYPDFPDEGVIFRDVSPLLGNSDVFNALLDDMAQAASKMGTYDLIAGLDARGFIFGAALAAKVKCGLVMIRKKGKLPQGDLVQTSYDLEYGQATIEVHKEIIEGKRVLIVDDVMATGGTAKAAMEVVKVAGGTVVGVITPVELLFLNGKEKLGDIPFASFIQY